MRWPWSSPSKIGDYGPMHPARIYHQRPGEADIPPTLWGMTKLMEKAAERMGADITIVLRFKSDPLGALVLSTEYDLRDAMDVLMAEIGVGG